MLLTASAAELMALIWQKVTAVDVARVGTTRMVVGNAIGTIAVVTAVAWPNAYAKYPVLLVCQKYLWHSSSSPPMLPPARENVVAVEPSSNCTPVTSN